MLFDTTNVARDDGSVRIGLRDGRCAWRVGQPVIGRTFDGVASVFRILPTGQDHESQRPDTDSVPAMERSDRDWVFVDADAAATAEIADSRFAGQPEPEGVPV